MINVCFFGGIDNDLLLMELDANRILFDGTDTCVTNVHRMLFTLLLLWRERGEVLTDRMKTL